MAQKFSKNTPVRLQDEVYDPFVKYFGPIIEEHGATYTVNMVVADHLRSLGVSVPEPITPGDRIARGQRNRWKSLKSEIAGELEKNEARREAKRERDRRYRLKKKSQKSEKGEST
jgi:hypothetical protein